jgi:hypothetical protein
VHLRRADPGEEFNEDELEPLLQFLRAFMKGSAATTPLPGDRQNLQFQVLGPIPALGRPDPGGPVVANPWRIWHNAALPSPGH